MIPETKLCKRCNTTKSSDEFYRRRDGSDLSAYCKPCQNNQTTERQQRLKQEAVTYLGGKCSNCGYKKYQGALEFHHKNPDEKDFSISHCARTSFEKVKSELDKCILLCSNCHKERHAGL